MDDIKMPSLEEDSAKLQYFKDTLALLIVAYNRIKEENQQLLKDNQLLYRVRKLMETGTAENFLKTNDECKKSVFSMYVLESSKRKELEKLIDEYRNLAVLLRDRCAYEILHNNEIFTQLVKDKYDDLYTIFSQKDQTFADWFISHCNSKYEKLMKPKEDREKESSDEQQA